MVFQVAGHIGGILSPDAQIQQVKLHQLLGVFGGQHILGRLLWGYTTWMAHTGPIWAAGSIWPQQGHGLVLGQGNVVAHLVDVLQVLLGVGFVVAVHDAGGSGD